MSITLEVSHDDAEFLAGILPDDPSDEQIGEIAEALLQRMIQARSIVAQAEIIVHRVVNLRRGSVVRQQAMEASKHYVFAKLDKSASPAHPVYAQYKVYARHFQAFCKENSLSEKEMLKVGSGQLENHKGWRQGSHPGSLGTARNKVLERGKPGPALMSGPFGGAIRTPSSGSYAAAAPVFLQVTTWKPAEE
jgi:hypothetical protein